MQVLCGDEKTWHLTAWRRGTSCLALLVSLGLVAGAGAAASEPQTSIPETPAPQIPVPQTPAPQIPAPVPEDGEDADADFPFPELPPESQQPADQETPPGSGEKPVRPRGVSYSFAIEGLKDEGGADLFKEISLLRKNRGKPARAQAELQSWIQHDIKALNNILRAQGYYGNRVSYRLDRRTDPLAVTLRVSEGKRFEITAFDVALLDMPESALAKSEAELIRRAISRRLPKKGAPAESARVIEAESRVMQRLPQIGYPRAALRERAIVVDHATGGMDVTLNVAPGPRTCFGEPEFTGAPNVKRRYLDRLAPWKFGDVYDSRVVEDFRESLSETFLFSGIATEIGEADRLGCVPIAVTLTEDKPRSYGFGATYGSSDGFGVNAFWEHRNFSGGGERLRAEGKAVEIEQSLTGLYEIPGFLRRNQWLLLNGGFKRESPDAYTSYNVGAGAAVRRELTRFWTVQIGSGLEFSSVDDGLAERKYYLLGGQGMISYDSTDDLFDPRRGYKASLSLRPYVGEQSGFLNFNIAEISSNSYWALDRRRRTLIATRVRFGSIFGEDLNRLPADKRFYAGGGASVRGYAYQAAGPLDAAGTPVGGRSLIEGSLELRARITDTIGIVPFVDVGSVGRDVLPDFSDKLFWGAGLGFRYYTSFAPVRIDLAVPLNRRPGESRYQIYISLGQSF